MGRPTGRRMAGKDGASRDLNDFLTGISRVRKKSLYLGDLSDLHLALEVSQAAIVHFFDEWAEARPNTTEMSASVHSDSLSKPDWPMSGAVGHPTTFYMLSCSAMDEGDMEYNVPPNGSIDLDALDGYLMSDHAPDDSMGLSDLDGFLTGIVVGPELILPSEWLPVIWGGEEPEFETEAEMRTVLGTIMGRYNEIAACFNTDPDEFDPIFWEGPEGEVIASDWAGGFLDAVALRPKAWEPLIEKWQCRHSDGPIIPAQW